MHAVEPSDAMRWLGQQIEQRSKLESPMEVTDSEYYGAKYDSQSPSLGEHGSADKADMPQERLQGQMEMDVTSSSDSESSSLSAEHPSRQNGEVGSPEGRVPSSRLIIGEGLASPESNFGRSWSIRWLQHLQGFGDRRQVSGRRTGSRNPRRPTWVQSTGICLHGGQAENGLVLAF